MVAPPGTGDHPNRRADSPAPGAGPSPDRGITGAVPLYGGRRPPECTWVTQTSQPATGPALSTTVTASAPPVPAQRGTARHRAPETGEIRIVAAADCARQGRHAADDDTDPRRSPAADPAGEDPLAWLGFRFTAG